MTAGPTPVPPAVSQAMATPMLYHRAPAFVELYERVLAKLPKVFQTDNDVLTFAASGSGAMDSAVGEPRSAPARRCSPAAAGKFGERWIELDDGLRRRARPSTSPAGASGWTRPEIGRLCRDRRRGRLRHAQRDVAPASSTTSRRSPRWSTATARSSSSTPSPASAPPSSSQDEWGVDVVVAGSQKALMIPPGLAFASRLPEGARLRGASARRPLLLRLGQDRQVPTQGQLALHARRCRSSRRLDVALDLIEEEGLDNVFARHDLLARATRAGIAGLGLELYGNPDERSTVVTALELPEHDRRRQGARRPAQARHHGQRRPGPPEGQDPADRPLRLLRRVRHPHQPQRRRDGARPARPRGRARRRRRRRAEGVRRTPASPAAA